ncbi:MAG: PP2C family protein-serine/threonine phosphatase [Pseudomonadota bacterium]|jgi:serine phosphatase RsbU (regulator of sigma subunit)
MDTVFFLGDSKDQIPAFLGRLGYAVLGVGIQEPIPDVVAHNVPDVILIDGRVACDAVNLLEFFRSQESTKDIPIVCVSPDSADTIDQLAKFDRVELLPSTSSVGVLASRIATVLRLRKTAGADDMQGSLAEMNLALRDFNARMKKDLEEAREIQRSLMPQKLPRDPRFQLAVSYHPLEEVGGDWYSVELNEAATELQLHIADVSGHGLPAAFLASMAKLAMVAAEGLEPDKLLEKMSSYLHPQLPKGRFITTGHALYRPDSGEVLWARAGHGPALVRRKATGRVEQLYGEGFPIGFVSGEPYELVRDYLHPGDLLVVYTDGLTEAQNRAMEQFSLERLCQVIADIPDGLSAGKMVEWIIDALARFLDERLLKDDVTLLLLKREERVG